MPDPEVRNITSGGALRFVGILFLLAGAGGLYFIYVHSGAAAADSLEIMIVSGSLALFGFAMTFVRWGIVVDRRAGTWTRWWGVIVPMRRTVVSLSDVSHVHLSREVRSSGKNSKTVYPVRLALKEGGKGLQLVEGQKYEGSRQQAESFAKFLRLGVHDATAGETVIREAAHLDESVRQRHRRLGIPAPFPEQPDNALARLRYGGAGGTTVIEIPPAGFGAIHAIMIGGIVLFFAVSVPGMLIPSRDSGGWAFHAIFMAMFIGLPLAAVLGFIATTASRRETITVSASGIGIEIANLFGRRTTQLAEALIEEIVPPRAGGLDFLEQMRRAQTRPGKTLTAAQEEALRKQAQAMQWIVRMAGPLSRSGQVLVRTDEKTVGVGGALPDDEKKWLREMLVHALVGDTRGMGGTSAPAGFSPEAPPPVPGPPVSPVPAMSRGPVVAPASGRGLNPVSWLFLAAAVAVAVHQLGWFDRAAEVLRSATEKRQQQPAKRQSATPSRTGPGGNLEPAPEATYIHIFGEGVAGSVVGSDLHVRIRALRLESTGRMPVTKFRFLGMDAWQRAGNGWDKLGESANLPLESELKSGEQFAFPEPQEFVVPGAAPACQRDGCVVRLRLNVWAQPDPPGWDMTGLSWIDVR